MCQLSLASAPDNNTNPRKLFYANLCDRTYMAPLNCLAI